MTTFQSKRNRVLFVQ